MKIRFISALAAVTLLLFTIITACRKSDSITSTAEKFDVVAAKEWWYGTFRKSESYSQLDKRSPYALPEGSSNKKYPRWKKAISYTKRGLQIVEMPLVFETNSILLPGMQDLNKTPEGARVAKSSMHKLIIIKGRSEVQNVRVVTIVPAATYAKKYHYDISHVNMEKLPVDFEGYIMITDWSGSEKSAFSIKRGKPHRKLNIITGEMLSETKLKGQLSRLSSCPPPVWVPHLVWVCVIAPSGDDLADAERCQEQGHWEENGGYYEYPPCEGEDPPPTDEELCQWYGINCDEEEGGTNGTGNEVVIADDPEYTCPTNFIFVAVTTNNLWQEAKLTNIYCNIVNMSNPALSVQINITQLYFGMPYYNVEGQIVYTSGMAQIIAADAINLGEYDMRQYYKRNPTATALQLQNYWIDRSHYHMRLETENRGKVGRQGSSNPINTVPSIPYSACQ
ncbi:MAG: hypothetical protein J0L56_03285 [Chitinophagales bacterium]|nr:hypothetical protein [Chitinophagales bacterium]